MVTQNEVRPISRREFLYYIWGGGAGLLGIGVCGASAWYALPREDLTGKVFSIDLDMIPESNAGPKGFPEGKFWLANAEDGLLAFNMTCPVTRAGRIFYKWVPTNNRFECPQCGSKYRLDGTYVEGPALQHLNRYMIHVSTPRGTRKTSEQGDPVNITDATSITVDTRKLIPGKIVSMWG